MRSRRRRRSRRQRRKRATQAEKMRAMRAEAKAELQGETEELIQAAKRDAGGDHEVDIVINHKSWTIHRPHAEDPDRTACPYVKKMAEHYERAHETLANLNMYQRCPWCFAKSKPIMLLEWEQAECEQPATDTSSSTGSSTSEAVMSTD